MFRVFLRDMSKSEYYVRYGVVKKFKFNMKYMKLMAKYDNVYFANMFHLLHESAVLKLGMICISHKSYKFLRMLEASSGMNKIIIQKLKVDAGYNEVSDIQQDI